MASAYHALTNQLVVTKTTCSWILNSDFMVVFKEMQIIIFFYFMAKCIFPVMITHES